MVQFYKKYDPFGNTLNSEDPTLHPFCCLLTPDYCLLSFCYLYCQNDPVNYWDPRGEWAITIGISASGNLTPKGINRGGWVNKGLQGFSRLASTDPSFAEWYMLLQPLYSAMLDCDWASLGATGGLSFAMAHDETKDFFNYNSWSWGFLSYIAGGSELTTTGSGATANIDFGFSPQAQHVRDLEGRFAEYGGSLSTPPIPWMLNMSNFAFTVSIGIKEDGTYNNIYLYTFSPGWVLTGPSLGVEGHAFFGKTWVMKAWGAAYEK